MEEATNSVTCGTMQIENWKIIKTQCVCIALCVCVL